ncbi:MAG: nucleotidyltransferase [Kiritimatiellaeota bacterium]|nr:nucleotidyltransferase [Kiritimatiellota bacterium]
MPKPALLVLAAGMGSRYGGLKQLDPVGPDGEIIIDYSIYDTIRAGFGKVVFVIRRDIEEIFKKVIGTRYENKIAIEYAFQELDNLPEGFSVPDGRTKPWGTGHAILMAENFINEPFAVINADDFYGCSGFTMLYDYLSTTEPAFEDGAANFAMVGYYLRNTLSDNGTVARGVCAVDSNDFLEGVDECTKIERKGKGAFNTAEGEAYVDLTGDEIVSLNFWGFQPSIFNELRSLFGMFLTENHENLKSEFFIPTVVDELIRDAKAKVSVLRSEDKWFGITYKDDKPSVVSEIRTLVERGAYPEALFAL